MSEQNENITSSRSSLIKHIKSISQELSEKSLMTKGEHNFVRTRNPSSTRKSYSESIRRRSNSLETANKPNFLIMKISIAVIVLLTVIFFDMFSLKVGNFTSEKIFHVLYYNENMNSLGDFLAKFKIENIQEAWNNLK